MSVVVRTTGLLMLALTGCAPRQDLPGAIDIPASYEMRRTEYATLPRSYHGTHPMGATYTHADIVAVQLLGIGVTERVDVVTGVVHGANRIDIEPWMPRSVLWHETIHAGQLAGGVPEADHWRLEAGAMIGEVACLMSEGWSDDRIRGLSPNNQQTPRWVFEWIRQCGPQFTGTSADAMVAYQWGKSAVAIGTTAALIDHK